MPAPIVTKRLTLGEEHRLRVFDDEMPQRLFEANREKVGNKWVQKFPNFKYLGLWQRWKIKNLSFWDVTLCSSYYILSMLVSGPSKAQYLPTKLHGVIYIIFACHQMWQYFNVIIDSHKYFIIKTITFI